MTAHLYSELLLQMHNRLERLKRDRAVLTFDDLLARTDAAVTHPQRKAGLLAAIQGRYSVALIDEFQDTDERQYSILSNCFRNRPLFLVGDPKQSIYSFRGADLDTYLGASRDAVERHTLSVNFRSAHLLVNAVNHLFSRNGSFIEPDIRMPKVRANANPDELLITDDQGDDSPMQFRMLAYATNIDLPIFMFWGHHRNERMCDHLCGDCCCHVYGHVCGHVCTNMCIDTCMDMCQRLRDRLPLLRYLYRSVPAATHERIADGSDEPTARYSSPCARTEKAADAGCSSDARQRSSRRSASLALTSPSLVGICMASHASNWVQNREG